MVEIKRTIEWSRCSSRKVAYFQLCAPETSNKANCFHCLILLIYAIAWAVLFGRRPKLPEWDTAFKDCFHALFFDLKLPILFFRRSRAVFQKRSNLSWWTSTFRPASPQTEGKPNLYLRFAPLLEKSESVKTMIYQCNTIIMKSDFLFLYLKIFQKK